MVLLGFDPGGKNSFGWATLCLKESGAFVTLESGVESNAPDAVRAAAQHAPATPHGIGIDAPLFWVDKGDRRADATIRTRVVAAGGQSGTVSSVNSLRGACVVQGILTARLVATEWPTALVTEAHPKALLRLSVEAQTFVETHLLASYAEHSRDAALAALAAWAAVTAQAGWINLVLGESEPFFPGGREVSYWFPT